jgi:hypothetical protein
MVTLAGDLILGLVETFSVLNDFILEQIEGGATETATITTKDYSKKRNHIKHSPRTRHEVKNREDTNAEGRSQSPTKRSSQNDMSPTKRSSSTGRQGESRDQPQRNLSPARVAMAGERKKSESPQRKRVPEQKKKYCRSASSGHRGTRKAPASSRQSSVGKKVPIDPKHRHSKSPETEVRGRSQSRRSASPDKARRKAVRTVDLRVLNRLYILL